MRFVIKILADNETANTAFYLIRLSPPFPDSNPEKALGMQIEQKKFRVSLSVLHKMERAGVRQGAGDSAGYLT